MRSLAVLLVVSIVIPGTAEAISLPVHPEWSVANVHLADTPQQVFKELNGLGYKLVRGEARASSYGFSPAYPDKPLDQLKKDPTIQRAQFQLDEQNVEVGFTQTLEGPRVHVVHYWAPSIKRPALEAVTNIIGRIGNPTSTGGTGADTDYTWCERPNHICNSIDAESVDALGEKLRVFQRLSNKRDGYDTVIDEMIGMNTLKAWKAEMDAADAEEARKKHGNAY